MSPTLTNVTTTTATTVTTNTTPTGPDARYPIALLPVRLETRLQGNLLKVRIFPDEIFADTHEPALTAAEAADGAAYVAAMKAGGSVETDAWRTLVARYTAPRAAWIALASQAGSPASRSDSWTRAAQAQLPDSWVVRAYQGTNVFTAVIPKVTSPLALSVSPNPGTQVAISDGLSVDADLEWTLHYDAAVAAGMAVTIDLTTPDGANLAMRAVGAGPGSPGPVGPIGPVEPPVVTGPITPLPPAPPTPPQGIDVVVVGLHNLLPDAAAAQLRALIDAQHYTRGFAFVPPGTPTSNGGDGKTQYPPPDTGGAASFAVERQGPLAGPGDNSDGDRFARALGLPLAAGEKLAAVEHVAGAGAATDHPAQAMNDSLWPATLGYFMEQMMAPRFDAATIEAARAWFVNQVRPGGPLPAFRVGRVPYGLLPVISLAHFAPDSQLSKTLRLIRDSHFVPAVAQVPRVTAGSADPDGDLLKALALDASCRQVRMRILLGQDVTSNTAGIFGLIQQQQLELQRAVRAAAAAAVLNGVGLTADARLGHIDPAQVAQLLGAPLISSAPISETSGVTYIDQLIAWASQTPPDVLSIQNDKLPGTDRPLLYRLLRHALLLEMDRVTSLPTTTMVMARAVGPVAAPVDRTEPELVNLGSTPTLTNWGRIQQAAAGPSLGPAIKPYLASLGGISKLSSAELEHRFGETLDSCTHRLESWITGLANQQLWTMRAKAVTGCHLGAFGWVESVLPAGTRAPLGGYIHAPSAAHASAAAILRNGYLSRGGSGSTYAVDLSSARVRGALDLLNGTRQGEPLAALLGYQFERALHEAGLERLIANLRTQFPLVANRTDAGTGPAELVAATNVVDGLALRKSKPAPPAGLSATESQAFHIAVAALDNSVDALSDLLMAESVFQTVRGNPAATVASLDATAQGVSLPDPDVVRTPLGGAAFTQRLAVILDGTQAAPAGATPRAAVEPFLDAWAATLLGDFTQVGCRVVQADGSTKEVTLDRLALRPLDLLALARAQTNGDGELDRRVLTVAPGASIQYDATNSPHSFAERLEVARALAELVGGARALTAADLAPPHESVPVTAATAALAVARANLAIHSLSDALSGLSSALASSDPTALRSALQAAALLGVSGAYPDANATAPELVVAATAAQGELAARQSRVPALTATDPGALVDAATSAVQAVFGRDFRFLPQLMPSSDLPAALAQTPALVGDANLPRRVLQQMARVRAGAGRWRSLFLYAQALGTAAPTIDAAQLPLGQSTWAGGKGAAPADGTLSLLLHRPTAVSPASQCAGLVIDEWTELIPSPTQPTAISFRHQTPVAEAPQAVLLAVPPPSATVWDQQTIFDTVRESLLLAKIRLVDTVDTLRPFLPAVCLTGNTANETVSSNFLTALIADPKIVGSV